MLLIAQVIEMLFCSLEPFCIARILTKRMHVCSWVSSPCQSGNMMPGSGVQTSLQHPLKLVSM